MKRLIKAAVPLVFVHWVILGLQCSPRPRFHAGSTANTDPSPRLFKSEDDGNSNIQRLTEVIWSYLGVPYRWGGTSREGMDCSGFVSTVFREAVNVHLPHSARRMFHQGAPVPRGKLQFGDLVFFKNIESAGVSHVGIYLNDGHFVHASTHRGVIISKVDESYYRVRFVGARRVSLK